MKEKKKGKRATENRQGTMEGVQNRPEKGSCRGNDGKEGPRTKGGGEKNKTPNQKEKTEKKVTLDHLTGSERKQEGSKGKNKVRGKATTRVGGGLQKERNRKSKEIKSPLI